MESECAVKTRASSSTPSCRFPHSLVRSRVPVCVQGIGTMFREGRILCVLQVTAEYVLLGTQSGKIWVFNTLESKLLHASKQLQDSVLCLHLISR